MNHLQNMHSLRDAANYALYTIASILGPLLRTYCPDEVSQLPPEYPGWMQEVQNVDRLGPLNSSNFVV
jgi:hypothetical protein